VIRVLQVPLDHLVYKVHVDIVVILESKETKEKMGIKEPLVIKVILDLKESLEFMERLVQEGRKV
jgi:hypothetical protein